MNGISSMWMLAKLIAYAGASALTLVVAVAVAVAVVGGWCWWLQWQQQQRLPLAVATAAAATNALARFLAVCGIIIKSSTLINISTESLASRQGRRCWLTRFFISCRFTVWLMSCRQWPGLHVRLGLALGQQRHETSQSLTHLWPLLLTVDCCCSPSPSPPPCPSACSAHLRT